VVFVSVVIRGRVQGVGYRFWLRQQADRGGVQGWVRNLSSGAVEAYFAGDRKSVEDILVLCHQGPKDGHVADVNARDAADEAVSGFHIRRDAS